MQKTCIVCGRNFETNVNSLSVCSPACWRFKIRLQKQSENRQKKNSANIAEKKLLAQVKDTTSFVLPSAKDNTDSKTLNFVANAIIKKTKT